MIRESAGWGRCNRESRHFLSIFSESSILGTWCAVPSTRWAHSGAPFTAQPSALAISSSDLPMPTAISTSALEMASFVPSCISSGVIGMPSFRAFQ